MKALYFLLPFLLSLTACSVPPPEGLPTVPQWTTIDLQFNSTKNYPNPYTDTELNAIFWTQNGDTIHRPGFWNGDSSWVVRFAPPDNHRIWQWKTSCSQQDDTGLHAQKGRLQATAYNGENHLLQHGLLRMSPGRRSVIHADGHPFLLIGDTPWALPFRARQGQARTYAAYRQNQGFNAALLMSLQPDMRAEGPDARDTELGFARAFDDLTRSEEEIALLYQQLKDAALSEGQNPPLDGFDLRECKIEYFHYLDSLANILLDHEIVPVWQPIFHGFGWKGLDVFGNYILPEAYERYTRYLLARYGSYPALWLLGGDNGGKDPGIKEAGEMLEIWDSYQQPTGLHYSPADTFVTDWSIGNPTKHVVHYNRSYQAEPWLDFQWAQTGHGQAHEYHKVAYMYDHQPNKGVANGEPTYEGMNDGQNGLGWWQGEDAWGQLMSGGTMGVVYGAAGLWQWKVSADEVGWTSWATQNKSWEGAMRLEGARYVGYLHVALAELDLTDIERRPDLTENGHWLLAREGELYLSFLPRGGQLKIPSVPRGLRKRWFNPKEGHYLEASKVTQTSFTAPNDQAWVLVIDRQGPE